MLSRREFLRKSALVTAGVIAAHQLELLDRLAPRSLFSAWPMVPRLYGDGIHDDTRAIQAMMDAAAEHNGLVIFPRGIYRITAPLDLRSNLSLRGGHFVAESTPLMRAAGDVHNVSLEGCRFEAIKGTALQFDQAPRRARLVA